MLLRGPAFLLVPALVLAVGCGGSGESATTGSSADTEGNGSPRTDTSGSDGVTTVTCQDPAGSVAGYVPVTERTPCAPGRLLVATTLYAADRVATAAGGQLDFTFTALQADCKLRGAAVIRPDERTALRLLSGLLSCRVEPGGPKVRLATPGAELEIVGTLFSLDAEGNGTTIDVYEGTLRVTSTLDGSVIDVVGGKSLFIRADEAPLPPPVGTTTAPGPPAAEPRLVTLTRLGVVTVTAEGIEQFLATRPDGDGALVTQTAGQAGVVAALTPTAPPKVVTVDEISQGAEETVSTYVVAGAFDTLRVALEALRARHADAAIAFVPFVFPDEPVGETTDTGTETQGTDTQSTATGGSDTGGTDTQGTDTGATDTQGTDTGAVATETTPG